MATHKCNWADVNDEDDRASCRVAQVCDAHKEEDCDRCKYGMSLCLIHDDSSTYLVNDRTTGFNPSF
jgi:hypothetical protein